MKKPVVRIVLVLSVLTLAGIVALAAGSRGIVTTQDGRMTIATHGTTHVTPYVEPAGLTTIAGNLSKYPFGVFFCCYGYTISGPQSTFGEAYWVAVPFTPSANYTVKALEASVGFAGGVNGVTLSLNADASGLPGPALASANVTNLEGFGECCTLAIGKDSAGVSINQGTQYWLVVSTSTSTATSFDAWALNSTDMRSYSFAAYNSKTGAWGNSGGVLPGYAVLGN
jgi:hypothetical protein